MKVKCSYCDEMISIRVSRCPHCGGVNSFLKRTADGTPTTIEELKGWCVEHHLPPSRISRFFIGEDYREPKAFGIYQDGVEFVTYCNDAAGNRHVFYEGTDEAYAVNDMYIRLKNEIMNQKAHQVKK